MVENKSRYLRYMEDVFVPTYGKEENLEEALAHADIYLRIGTNPYRKSIGDKVVKASKDYLVWRFRNGPPDRRRALDYLSRQNHNRGSNLLCSQVQEGTLKPNRDPRDWELGTRLLQSQFKVTDHLWAVVPKGSQPRILPGAVPYPAISTKDLIKLVRTHEYEIRRGAGKGSHIRMEKPNAPSVTIPANRKCLSPKVLKSTLKALGDYGLADIPELLKAV